MCLLLPSRKEQSSWQGNGAYALPAPFLFPLLHPPLAQHWSFLYLRAMHSFSMFPILFPVLRLPNQVLLTQPPIKDRGENGELLAASPPPQSLFYPPQACPLSLCFVILGGVHLPKALSLDNSGLLR